MADFSSQIATAARLIRQKGMTVTHRRKLFSGTYDPVTDSYTEASVDTDVWAVRTEAGDAEVRNYGFSIGSAVLYVADDKAVGNEDAVQHVSGDVEDGRANAEAVVPHLGVSGFASDGPDVGVHAGLGVAADVLDGILVSDLFVIGGTVWAIQNVATTAPAEAPVLYAVELKSQGSADV